MEEDKKLLEFNFLQEYEKLCQKYKMRLCGSSFLNKIVDINYNETLNCVKKVINKRKQFKTTITDEELTKGFKNDKLSKLVDMAIKVKYEKAEFKALQEIIKNLKAENEQLKSDLGYTRKLLKYTGDHIPRID